MRATISSADATPWTASAVWASRAALTGAIASPKPRPPSTSDRVSTWWSREWASHVDMCQNATALITIARHVSDRGRDLAEQPAAEHRADRQRDQEAYEHQGRVELRVAVDRQPGEERDVDERCDQRGADEERHDQRAPRRSCAQGTTRDQRTGGPALAHREAHEGDDGDRDQPRRLAGDRRTLGLGRRERQDDGAEPGREQQRAGDVGVTRERRPLTPADERVARRHLAQQEQDQRVRTS